MDSDQINLRRLDFSMLLVFCALIRLQKTTAVALELGLSQSAISHALSRLRDVFDDPLFTRLSYGLQPTFRAMELLPKVEAVLRAARSALDKPVQFAPQTSNRSFRIGGNDLVAAIVAPTLTALLRRDAPNCRVAFPLTIDTKGLSALRANELDFVIGLTWEISDEFRSELLFEDRFAVALRQDHPAAKRNMNLKTYLSLEHIVATSRGGGYWGLVDTALKRKRLTRRIVATVPAFLTAMSTAAQSDLVTTVPSRLAVKHAKHFGLVLRKVPLEIDGYTVGLTRHVRSASDPGIDWLATKILEASKMTAVNFE
jgi:DNA-binding transcriptional LysR family regulator